MNAEGSRRRALALWALAGAAGFGGLALLSVWVPAPGPENTLCFSRRILGLPCPGCGLTRAFAHLAKGEWSAALAAHPFAPLLAAETAAAWIACGVLLARRRPLQAPAWFEPAVLGHVAVLFALWLGRLSTGTLPW